MLWVSWGQNMMSHIYEGLPRNTTREAGSAIPGHARDRVMPGLGESGQILAGGRWRIGSCWFFAGEEWGKVKANIHTQHVLTNSHFTTNAASWHCCLQLQNTGFNVSVSLSSILCWTIYSWENKCCNSRFIVSFRQVLVMHVKSKAFF